MIYIQLPPVTKQLLEISVLGKLEIGHHAIEELKQKLTLEQKLSIGLNGVDQLQSFFDSHLNVNTHRTPLKKLYDGLLYQKESYCRKNYKVTKGYLWHIEEPIH